jgi:GNAT superfamily N-acetyltransferase
LTAVEDCRPATIDDVPRLVELAEQAIAELSALRGGALWSRTAARRPPLGEGFATDLEAASHHVVVGTYAEVPLGYGVARVDVLDDGSRLGVVSDLYVEPAAREVGIGEALMRSMVEWCAAQGCTGVDSLALPGDRATKNFFESFGLVARALLVHKELEP